MIHIIVRLRVNLVVSTKMGNAKIVHRFVKKTKPFHLIFEFAFLVKELKNTLIDKPNCVLKIVYI